MPDIKQYCLIEERVKDRYYYISIPELEFKQLFWNQKDGFTIIKYLHEKNLLSAEELQQKAMEVFQLPLIFMRHPLVLLKPGRECSEKKEKRTISCNITEALAKEQVFLTKKPVVVTHRIPDEPLEAYILTDTSRSDLFTTTEDGIEEAQDMFADHKIDEATYVTVIQKIRELFGYEDIFKGNKYPISPN